MGLFDGIIGGIVGVGMASAVKDLLEKHGGVEGVVQQFQQQGFGNTVKSWVNTGPNDPISPDEIHKVLGSDTINELAAKAGITPDELKAKLSQLLPGVIDKLTPGGVMPRVPEVTVPHITAAHLHVLVNHIPVIGFPFLALLMLWGLVRKQDDVIRAALLGAVLIGAGTWLADTTGDGAKNDIRNLSWYNKAQVHEHEAAADYALMIGIATGVLALGTLVLARGGRPVKRSLAYGVFGFLVFGSAIAAKTGYEGGKIRHDEFGTVLAP